MTIHEYGYSADAGSLAIGTGKCRVLVGNSVGDGDFRVIIADREDFMELEGDFAFVTACEGEEVTVFDYDCSGGKPLCVMAGRFGIYRHRRFGDMALVRWDSVIPSDFQDLAGGRE